MTTSRTATLPKVLFEIGKVIGSDEDLATLLRHISELATEAVGGDAVSIMLLNAARTRLLAKAAHGLRVGRLELVSFGVGEGVAGWVVEHGEPALIEDVDRDARFVSRAAPATPIRAMVCVPLVVRGTPIGVMTATSRDSGAFDEASLDMLSFIAQTIALDIENVRLAKVAVTDPLTSAYNREFLVERLPREMAAAGSQNTPLSIAMVDVDHFKRVNDRFGHDTGDRVLVVVAERLRSAIRASDMLVRYGGEEFLVLLPATDLDIATDIAERMRAKMQENPIHAAEATVDMRVSIGVAAHAGPQDTADHFIRRADGALYSAKRQGRNRVVLAQ